MTAWVSFYEWLELNSACAPARNWVSRKKLENKPIQAFRKAKTYEYVNWAVYKLANGPRSEKSCDTTEKLRRKWLRRMKKLERLAHDHYQRYGYLPIQQRLELFREAFEEEFIRELLKHNRVRLR